jgi:hypothetical protein
MAWILMRGNTSKDVPGLAAEQVPMPFSEPGVVTMPLGVQRGTALACPVDDVHCGRRAVVNLANSTGDLGAGTRIWRRGEFNPRSVGHRTRRIDC